jgi:serine/threonine protein kinase
LNFIRSAENNYSSTIIKLYGITQDPETLNYMIVMDHIKLGSLRSNLKTKKYNPNDKYRNLYCIAKSLLTLHKCNLVHGDLHSGNLLLSDNLTVFISDFGLSRPADKPISKKIYGVLPYIAPEVLRGKPYTKAADIYSFGIIMWELTSGIPAFVDSLHDVELCLNICKGLRPKIVKDTGFEYAELMKRCWDSDPNKRPTAEELHEYTKRFHDKYYDKFTDYTERTPIPGKQ